MAAQPVPTPATQQELAATLVAKLISGGFAKITAEVDTFTCNGMPQPANTLTIRADGFVIAELNILSPEVESCVFCTLGDEEQHCSPKCHPYLDSGFVLEVHRLNAAKDLEHTEIG